MSIMVKCGWDGCTTRTKDSSGLCHDHRRMSLPVRQKVAGFRPDRDAAQMRLSGIPMMTLAKPEAAQWVSQTTGRSIQAMRSKPAPHLNPDGSVIIRNFWSNGQSDNQVFWPGQGMVPADGSGDLLREGGDLHVRANAVEHTEDLLDAAQMKWEYDLTSVHGLQRSDMERYGDSSEAIAQLHLGEIAGYDVMISSERASEEPGTQAVRFVSEQAQYLSYMKYQQPWITRSGALARRYRFSFLTDGEQTFGVNSINDQEVLTMLDSIEHVRNVIENYKLPGDDHILLPMGWTEMEAPDYVD